MRRLGSRMAAVPRVHPAPKMHPAGPDGKHRGKLPPRKAAATQAKTSGQVKRAAQCEEGFLAMLRMTERSRALHNAEQTRSGADCYGEAGASIIKD